MPQTQRPSSGSPAAAGRPPPRCRPPPPPARPLTSRTFTLPVPCSSAEGALPTSLNGLAAAVQVGSGRCPFPALYAVFSLPNICTDHAFQSARAKFVAALTAVAGPGAQRTTLRCIAAMTHATSRALLQYA